MGEREQELLRALAAGLTVSGALRTPRWIRAFETVPRHVFVPVIFTDSEGAYEQVDGTAPGQRGRWLDLVYRDEPLVTLLGDRGTWLSSSSQPSLMASMLEALDAVGGERVLEVGTGTGYNAALLCAGLGSDRVTSIDIDDGLVSQARGRLRELGCTPALAVADGTAGYPGAAPYDRIIATCSLPRVPPAWITQSSPGGLILLSLYRELGGGALALLRVSDGQASGHFAPFYAGFMPTRDVARADAAELVGAHWDEHGERRAAEVPASVLGEDDFGVFAALRLPGVQRIGMLPDGEPEQTWLVAGDGSWACQAGATVRQGGPRRLWDQLEAMHRDWAGCDRPARQELGLTVTSSGEHRLWRGSENETGWVI
jgi:protein-L-isoaspartate(D-aspartate) O-methyltransferase